MFKLVTKFVLVSMALQLAVGCSRGGGKSSVCTVAARDASHDKEMLAWKSRLPSIVRFDFTRDKEGAVVAMPRCVKTAAQDPHFHDFVETTGVLGLGAGEKLRLNYDYVFFPKAIREAEIELTRDDKTWSGRFEENSLLSFMRSYDLALPSCTDAVLARPEVYQHRDQGGRLTRLNSLTDLNELICH